MMVSADSADENERRPPLGAEADDVDCVKMAPGVTDGMGDITSACSAVLKLVYADSARHDPVRRYSSSNSVMRHTYLSSACATRFQ